ncbi:protein of unknown function [Pseudomonas sp. JV551A1]|nr:protein of unknown function [Pseudomonas sp. JV551A1]
MPGHRPQPCLPLRLGTPYSCGSNCPGYLFKPALALVGAALCRDGPRSGPDNLCCEAENLGPLRAPSRHKAAPTGTAHGLRPVWPVGAALCCEEAGRAKNPLCR